MDDSVRDDMLKMCRNSKAFYAGHEWTPMYSKMLKSAVRGQKLENVVLGNMYRSSELRRTLKKFVKQGRWRRLWVMAKMDLKFLEFVVTWWRKREPDQTHRVFSCEVPASFEAAMIYNRCEKDGGASILSHAKASSSEMKIYWKGRMMIIIEFNHNQQNAYRRSFQTVRMLIRDRKRAIDKGPRGLGTDQPATTMGDRSAYMTPGGGSGGSSGGNGGSYAREDYAWGGSSGGSSNGGSSGGSDNAPGVTKPRMDVSCYLGPK
uniref:PH domain-containing protein n=1 Tax=Steinernema glaseri TaxID=37863 RepID=A0A1I7YK43_9BILA